MQRGSFEKVLAQLQAVSWLVIAKLIFVATVTMSNVNNVNMVLYNYRQQSKLDGYAIQKDYHFLDSV